MEKSKVIKTAEYFLSVIFYAGVFVFFTFFYNNHMHFAEQFQLFLLTDEFFLEKLGYPGGLSGYVGGFLTQFYYLSITGPVIIVGVLLGLQQVMKRILINLNPGPVLFPVSYIPSLLAGMILCNEYYPLSAVTGFLLAMLSGLVYVSIKNGRSRFITGLIMIPLTYWLAGGSYLSLLLIILIFELLIYFRSGKRNTTGKSVESTLKFSKFSRKYSVIYVLIAAGIPLCVRQYLILQPVGLSYMSEFYYNIPDSIPTAVFILFAIPSILMILVASVSSKEKNVIMKLTMQIASLAILLLVGLKTFVNFKAEETMTYDYLVRDEKWDEVLAYAAENPPRNYLSLAMLNLSLAKKGQLGNRMFNYDQHGINGLFLPFEREYVSAIMGNEIFYHLGLTNASQEYAFESMETIPNRGKSARVIKRLAETNLINAQYKVAEKYLSLLDKTIFYRKWARTTRAYLGNEENINSHPDWGEKRKFAVRNDYFFHVMNIEAVLTRMVKEHPDNKMAFEYLMAFYLVNKDLGNFVNYIPVIEKMRYREIPVSYQEAILYVIGLNNQDPVTNSPAYITTDTKLRMKAYAEIFSTYPDALQRLEKRFSGTYWFYLHFIEVEHNPVKEKENNTGST